MIVKQMSVGQIGTNCYLFGDEAAGVCALVDPGDQPRQIAQMVQETGLTLQYIFLTHGHFDHVLAVPGLLEFYPGTPVYIHQSEADPSGTPNNYMQLKPVPGLQFYKEGDSFTLGSLSVVIMNTPGHSPGSTVIKVGDRALFTGDTLFRGSCGRTDFATGSYEDMMHSLKRLHDLPGDYEVYPGHEGSSTLERERQNNYYMQEAVRSLP